MFAMITSLSFAQNGTSNAISNKNYMFAESYGNSNYACSITFKKEHKDSLNKIIEFVGDSNFKIPVGAEFFIGKMNDKKLKMKVI